MYASDSRGFSFGHPVDDKRLVQPPGMSRRRSCAPSPFALGQIDFQQYISYISVIVLLHDGDYVEVQPYRQDGTDWKLIVNDMLPRFVLVPAG